MNNKETSHLDTSLGIFFASQLHQFQCSTAATYTLKSRATILQPCKVMAQKIHIYCGEPVFFFLKGATYALTP